MILINGIPKAGNHALIKTLELLGVPTVERIEAKEGAIFRHCTTAQGIPEGVTKHLFMKRDPRNILISWIRFRSLPVTQGTIISNIKSHDKQNKTFIEHLEEYAGWLNDPSVYVIRFEDLVFDKGLTMQDIAQHIGVPYLSDAYENLPGLTRTWTGRYSNYIEHWTPEVEKVWEKYGGDEIKRKMGY